MKKSTNAKDISVVKLEYAQLCDRNKNNSKGKYFYIRGVDRNPCFFNGTWELTEGYVFTAFYAKVDRHLQDLSFYICQAGGREEKEIIISGHGSLHWNKNGTGHHVHKLLAGIRGKFRIICQGSGKTYGKRLIEWWEAGDKSIEYAQLCAKYLKYGIKEIPQEELEKLVQKPQTYDAVLGGDAFSKWLSTAAVLGGNQAKK